jgi:hypothetical protein
MGRWRPAPASSSAKKSGGISIRLGLPGLTAVAVLVVVGMAWSFILGVVVGRGHHPEQVVEEVVRQALPAPENTTANATVLRPEELQFFEKLHRMPVEQAAAPAESKTAAAASAAKAKPSAKKSVAARKDGEKPQASSSTRASSPTEGPQPQFVFEYQLAALDSAADAEAMVQRLKAAHVEARVSKASSQGKTWYRVLVRHRGVVETALEFKEYLKRSGFTDIVLRSRQPLDTPKN